MPGPLDGMTTMRQARAGQPGLKCLLTARFVSAPLWNKVELEGFHRQAGSRPELLVACSSWLAMSLWAALSLRISSTANA